MYADSLNALADLGPLPAAAPPNQREQQFVDELRPALRVAALLYVAFQRQMLRVADLYAGAAVPLPQGFAVDREEFWATVRVLLAERLLEPADPILQGVDLG